METEIRPFDEVVIALDEGVLAHTAPELVAAMLGVREATQAMTSRLSSLTDDPTQFAIAQDDLVRLDLARRAHAQRLGELASRALVLRSAAPEHKIPTEVPAEDVASVGTPPFAPLSQREVTEVLREKLRTIKSTPANDDRSALLSLAQHVTISATPPPEPDDEISALERASAEARVPQWKRMSEPAQVRWLTILVAWAKALEQEGGEGETRLQAAWRRLRSFSKHDSPGYIRGFARDAKPEGESWRIDAVEMIASLRGRSMDELISKRVALVRGEVDVCAERESKIPESWAYWRHVRGKQLVMIGGEVREERRLALEKAFECESLMWLAHKRPKQLESLVQRAAQGTIDIVLVNKFVSHKDTTALQQKSVVPVITTRLGYGVTAIKTAIEEYFSKYEPRSN